MLLSLEVKICYCNTTNLELQVGRHHPESNCDTFLQIQANTSIMLFGDGYPIDPPCTISLVGYSIQNRTFENLCYDITEIGFPSNSNSSVIVKAWSFVVYENDTATYIAINETSPFRKETFFKEGLSASFCGQDNDEAFLLEIISYIPIYYNNSISKAPSFFEAKTRQGFKSKVEISKYEDDNKAKPIGINYLSYETSVWRISKFSPGSICWVFILGRGPTRIILGRRPTRIIMNVVVSGSVFVSRIALLLHCRFYDRVVSKKLYIFCGQKSYGYDIWTDIDNMVYIHKTDDSTLKVISSALNNIPIAPGEKKYTTLMHIISMALHGRNQEMSSIHYQIGFILTHGACKQRDIERLAKLGLTVNSRSVQNKLSSWEDFLDTDLVQLKEEWKEGVGVKYQMIGDNWDKNILPSYRTSQDKTLSLHLFQVIAVVDGNVPENKPVVDSSGIKTKQYVPLKDNGEVIDEVFFGGDRLTDERIQSAQQAMSNGDTPKEKLQGFISKIEDWHRMMIFLEAICKLTYAQSTMDRGTACYFRNFLNLRNVKAEVKNAFRAYKLLYYTIFDACCCILFMKQFNTHDLEGVIEMPSDFKERNSEQKVQWLLNVCSSIVEEWFFENTDMFQELREILEDPDHPENYWVLNEEGRFPCHFCIKTYSHVGSLKTHKRICHQHNGPKIEKKKKAKTSANDDQLFNYIILLFKLTGLLKNLDTAIDMADGRRSVRSAKYELPIFNTTNKLKYVIGCIHLTALSEETLSPEQRDRLILNRTVNLQGGKNNNLALDEYVEMLNRDSKDIVTGHQTKESIIAHSKQYPHLIKLHQTL
ncbi:Hypothetical predicted protein [Mytilus galloprovincialis]|nr:Hypothetical predicted protein [Mytilus galloprovincialis]